MSDEKLVKIELMTQLLSEREVMLNESQKFKAIELYNQLRSKVIKIYDNYWDSKYWKRESEQIDRKIYRAWSAFLWITFFLLIVYFSKTSFKEIQFVIGFLQVLIATYFVSLLAKLNSMKLFASHTSQVKLQEAETIETNLKFFGETYENSISVLNLINEIKTDDSTPFHEIEDRLTVLEIKEDIAKFVLQTY